MTHHALTPSVGGDDDSAKVEADRVFCSVMTMWYHQTMNNHDIDTTEIKDSQSMINWESELIINHTGTVSLFGFQG